MGLIKSLFQKEEIVEHGIKSLTSGIDKSILTKEEAADLFLKFVEASAPMHVSRRVIACGVTAVWCAGFFIGVVCLLCDFKADDIMQFLGFYVMPPFVAIVSWYFWKGGRDKEAENMQKAIEQLQNVDNKGK